MCSGEEFVLLGHSTPGLRCHGYSEVTTVASSVLILPGAKHQDAERGGGAATGVNCVRDGAIFHPPPPPELDILV